MAMAAAAAAAVAGTREAAAATAVTVAVDRPDAAQPACVGPQVWGLIYVTTRTRDLFFAGFTKLPPPTAT